MEQEICIISSRFQTLFEKLRLLLKILYLLQVMTILVFDQFHNEGYLASSQHKDCQAYTA